MRKIQRILLATLLILISFVLYQQKTNLDTLDIRMQSLVVKKLDLSVLDSCGIITDGRGHGSCVAIRHNLILTAGHVIDHPGSWVEIDGVKYEIKSEWHSSEYDVGFVVVDGNFPCLPLGDDPKVQDKIYLVGSPFDPSFMNKLSSGIVCKTDVEFTQSNIDWTGDFICDALAGGGNSGGPVLDVDGNIVGIYVGNWGYAENFCVCVPTFQIKKALSEYDRLKRDTTVGTGERD